VILPGHFLLFPTAKRNRLRFDEVIGKKVTSFHFLNHSIQAFDATGNKRQYKITMRKTIMTNKRTHRQGITIVG